MNKATGYGGGLRVAAAGEATFSDGTLVGNTAQYAAGAYVYGGTATFKDGATIAQNEAERCGGGFYLAASGTLNVADAQITGNKAEWGGAGGYVDANATFAAVEFSANETAGNGGALYVAQSGGVETANVAIVKNQANYGGGVYVLGTASFTNATIADNIASLGVGACLGAEANTTFRNSIVVDSVRLKGTANAYNTLSSVAAWSNAGVADVVNFAYDATQPLFKDAANGNYTLADDSQALDRGDDEYAVAADGTALTTDLAGNDRVVGTAVDLGAYEFQVEAVSSAFADAFDELDFFVDEDELDALAKRLI